MNLDTIGKRISKLRKQLNITQDDLAKSIGVSSQAVSKWERGGTPDIELIPSIADFFNVTIDYLFGRKSISNDSLDEYLSEYILSFDNQDRLREAFEKCWVIERSIMRKAIAEDNIEKINEIYSSCDIVDSQMLLDSGISIMSLKESLQYFFISPEPEGGWLEALPDIDKYVELFHTLGNHELLTCLLYLYTRKNTPFTGQIFEKDLGINKNNSDAIIQILLDFHFLNKDEIEIDDEVKNIYTLKINPSFIALLILGKSVIFPSNNFFFYANNRNTPYLRKSK